MPSQDIAMTPTAGTNHIVWDRWVESYPTASTTATGNIWTEWVTSSSTSSTIATQGAWHIWVRNQRVITASSSTTVSASTTTASTARIWGAWSETYRISDQEFRTRQRRTAEQEAQYVQQQAQREQDRIRVEGEKQAARERAALLLQAHLTEEQRLELAAQGHFTIRSIDKNGQTRHYQIRKGFHQNVHEIDPATKKRLNTLCFHPQVRVPDEDSMLIQKLMLESPDGHEEALRVANISRYHN